MSFLIINNNNIYFLPRQTWPGRSAPKSDRLDSLTSICSPFIELLWRPRLLAPSSRDGTRLCGYETQHYVALQRY